MFGSAIIINIASIAITASNSTNVNPFFAFIHTSPIINDLLLTSYYLLFNINFQTIKKTH